MKNLYANIDSRNKWLIAGIGLGCFALYVLCLCFRPQESWCDDAFWADWARQLAVHNRYYTTVWGGGHPSYSPLYVFIMAIWYKVVGFSFFSAQFPNMCLTLVTYWILSLILVGRKYVVSWQGISCFSALYWFAPSMFWIYNCGRIEVLCLLLGILTSYSFIRAFETRESRYQIELFLFGLLLFATGVEGVVFATLFIIIYSAYHYRDVWQNKLLYLWHFGSYVTSLGILGIITWSTHCLHQFFDTMFGFSKTFTSMYFYMRSLIKGVKHGDMVIEQAQTAVTTEEPFFNSIISGYTLNVEYLIIFVLLIILCVLLCIKVDRKNVPEYIWVVAAMTVITPFVYVLAGRYVLYYTWAAYIPCVIALVMVFEKMSAKWLPLCMGIFMVVWFFVSPNNTTLRSLDFTHARDKQNSEDIAKAQIDPCVPTCIPYSWYYYIVNSNENIYFQGSGAYPDDLGVIIYAPNEYTEENFMNSYELQERCRIGNKIVYDILSRRE